MPYLQYCSSFKHLGHECRHTLELTVAGADTCQYGVDNCHFGFTTRNKAAKLGEQDYCTDLHTHTHSDDHASISDLKSPVTDFVSRPNFI